MPKKKKARKNTKNKNAFLTKRKLEYADFNGQVYGVVEKALGNRFFTVKCLPNKLLRCKARKKRVRIHIGDVVIVSLRDYDEKNGDIIHRYDSDEVKILQQEDILPTTSDFNRTCEDNGSGGDDDNDFGFDFESI